MSSNIPTLKLSIIIKHITIIQILVNFFVAVSLFSCDPEDKFASYINEHLPKETARDVWRDVDVLPPCNDILCYGWMWSFVWIYSRAAMLCFAFQTVPHLQ